MNTTMEIPRDEWVPFLDQLSRLHEEEMITVEVLRLDFGAQLQVVGLPLEGISADPTRLASTITIAAGAAPDQHIEHHISQPLHVRIMRGTTGDDEVLEIEAADESTTLLFFDGPKGWTSP